MNTENQVENQEVVEVIVEKTGMELMLETLVQTELKVSDYYCITLRSGGVDFQGNFKSDIVRDLIAKGYEQSISTMGYIELGNGVVRVTLT